MNDKDGPVKPGYKMTPLGEIPEDWEIKEFGTVVTKKVSIFDPSNQDEVRKCVELEHLDQNTGILIDYIYSNSQKSSKNVFKKGQVLFGKLRPYLKKYWKANFDGVCSSEIWVLSCINQSDSNDFLFYFVQSNNFFQVANVSSGSKMPRADWDYVSSFPFVFPPLDEQLAVAKALSTWDEAIEKTSRLIEQKELRKKALMQQLLTGKKRLRGFSGEWKEMRLGEVFSERNETKTQGLSLLTIGRDGIYLQSESSKRDVSSDDKSKYKRICPGDIGYNTMRMWQGRSVLSHLEGIVSPAYTVVTASEGHSSEFYALLFTLPEVVYKFYRHSQGLVSDTLNCKFPDFAQIKVHTPCVQEQIAIAKSFRIADTEIKIEKQKLEQLKLQKKALMQVLLTGKKRLV